MAFPEESARQPIAISDMTVTLFSPDPTGLEIAKAGFVIQIKMNDGSTITRRGDLSEHLTTAQKNSLKAFMDNLRTQAVAEILP